MAEHLVDEDGEDVPMTPRGDAEQLPPPPQQQQTSDQTGRTGREAYLEGVRRRIEAFETCAGAIATVTTSLQELSANLDTMQRAAQQLNTFTGGWLAVWRRPA